MRYLARLLRTGHAHTAERPHGVGQEIQLRAHSTSISTLERKCLVTI